ncbi:hypothetical protein V6N00_09465 [Tersicoccus sp. MR15.9]|uniref:hypothetical protein n=1 Tax=Tersicoccus mangrovi TaxID=3121635 RepID=UPI002FE6782C
MSTATGRLTHQAAAAGSTVTGSRVSTVSTIATPHSRVDSVRTAEMTAVAAVSRRER